MSLRPYMLLAGALLAAGRVADAQTDAVESALARAAKLGEAGRWLEGRALLQRAMDSCPTGDPGRSCRLRLTYAVGYSYQLEAQWAQSGERAALLERAAASYQRVLHEVPGHRATTENLAAAYRDLGRDADVQRVLLRDPRDTLDAQAALFLGDSYRAQKRFDAAVAAYRRAALAAPDDPAPRDRLVELYRLMPPDSAFALFRRLEEEKDWEVSFPGAAIDAYELVVRRVAERDVKTASDACRRWLRLLAETGLFTADRLASLGKVWFAKDMDALQRYLGDPTQMPPGTPLLQDGDGELVGRIALALGREALARGDAERASAYWWGAYRSLGPEPVVALELAREVAMLDARYPKLDTTGRRFQRIQMELFEGKAAVYRRADLEAIQRYHTTLGLIYAQRRQWGSLGNPQSALFQLSHAVQTARRRERNERFFQPLPQVQARLARGLVATGDSTRARVTYVDAAMAYLDADDPEGATHMLRLAAALRGAPAASDAALRRLVVARERVAAPGGAPAGCDAAIERVDAASRRAGLNAGFLARQRFKLLADCVAAGPGGIAPQDGARVLNAVLRDSVPLVGAGDLLRLDRAKAALLRAVDLPGQAARFDFDRPRALAKEVPGAVILLVLSGETRPTFVSISADAVLGARVVEAIGKDAAAVRLEVGAGTVTVVHPLVTAAVDSAVSMKIRGVKGVTTVRVRSR